MYNREITPRLDKIASYRGSVGHSALEAYYRELKEGSSVEFSRVAAYDVLKEKAKEAVESGPEGMNFADICVKLKPVLDKYFIYYPEESFRVLEVEKVFEAIIDDDINYGMILDLLVEYVSGPNRGEIAVIDHKFLYNFKSVEELEMDGQVPKYVQTVRANGIPVTMGVFNQIRWREMKLIQPSYYLRRIPARLNAKATEVIWNEQVHTAKEIRNTPSLPIRTLSGFICKNCDFQTLCRAEMTGESTETMLAINFKPRKRPLKNLARIEQI